MRLSAMWGNDQFYYLGLAEGTDGRWRTGSDSGFTNDLTLALDADFLQVTARHRMLTQNLPKWWQETKRTDEVSVDTTLCFKHPLADGLTLRGSALLGLELVGPLYGLQIQDAFHHMPGIRARTIEHGLQTQYDGDVAAGLTLGGGAGLDYAPVSFLKLSGDVAGRYTLGTGLGLLNARAGIELRTPQNPTQIRPFIAAEISAVAQTVNDSRLAMAGGYMTGSYLAPALSAGVDVGPVRGAFQMRANEGGAGQGVGEFTLSVQF